LGKGARFRGVWQEEGRYGEYEYETAQLNEFYQVAMPSRIIARPFYRPSDCGAALSSRVPAQLRDAVRMGRDPARRGRRARAASTSGLTTRENRTYRCPGRARILRGDRPPRCDLLIGVERRLVRFDLRTGAVVATLAELPDDPRVIINDGIAVPDGVIFGTKHLEFNRPIAGLYHFGTELRELIGGQTCSNGKYFHDGLLIDIDTQPKTITEYRYYGGPAA